MSRPANSQAILEISLELIAVVAFTLLAGISDQFGKVVVIMMFGFWMIFIITSPQVTELIGAYSNLAANTAGTGAGNNSGTVHGMGNLGDTLSQIAKNAAKNAKQLAGK